MKKAKIAAFAAVFTVASALTAVAQSVPRVALVTEGTPPNAGAWTIEHARGWDEAKKVFGDKVQFDYIPYIQEWSGENTDQLNELASQGYDMIFTAGFGYMNPTIQVAFQHPDVKFEHATGYIRSKNLSTYSPRFYEGRMSQGIIAANMTKTNRVGYIASFPIPEVIRGINAAYLAARDVNPDIEFDVLWIKSWYDPEREEEAARTLVARGADMLLQHTGSTAPMEVAEELGVHNFTQGTTYRELGPNAYLSGTINNWGPYYIKRIQALLDGTWESTDTWGGLESDMIAIGEYADIIPNRIQLQALDLVDRVREGRHHPFSGPVRKQDGSGWLAPGETASDSDLLSMTYFVEGITGVLPK